MDFILKNFRFGLVALVLCFAFVACDEDDDFRPGDPMTTDPGDGAEETNTIVDFAAANGFTSLAAAVEAAGLTATLSGDTEYTVFAPTNAAFDAFLADNGFASLDAVPVEVLTQVLMNHVQEGSIMSSELSTTYIQSMAQSGPDGENLSMYINTDDGVMINGVAEVTSADNEVDNGVVHAVDAVIGLPDVTTFAVADPAFSSLVAALTREDSFTFVETLQGEGPFTIFAPVNDAFQALLDSNDAWTSLDDIPADLLADVLSYHVIAGDNITSGELQDGDTAQTFLGQDITVNIDGSTVTITDASGGVSTVVATDVQATNGVIHAIDSVLLPSSE